MGGSFLVPVHAHDWRPSPFWGGYVCYCGAATTSHSTAQSSTNRAEWV